MSAPSEVAARLTRQMRHEQTARGTRSAPPTLTDAPEPPDDLDPFFEALAVLILQDVRSARKGTQ